MKPEKIKILFVDDSTTVRAKARQLFKKLNITNYHDANDGKVALRMTDEAEKNGERFDLIVSDLNMDEMNYFPLRKEYALEDGTRTDKNDSMFGR